MPRKNKQTIPASQAAKLMQISPQRLYDYCNSGVFESAHKKLGTRWYLEKWEVEKFIQGKIKVEGTYSKLEKVDEKKFAEYCKTKTCFQHKYIIPGMKNPPDRIIFCPKGITFFIEFKRKGEPAREGQKEFHKMMRRLGYQVFVCDTVKDAIKILDRILEPFQK